VKEEWAGIGDAIVGFMGSYGVPPTGMACAPGRLNLIGEHIDYCGLTVLPMAIRRSVWVAFAPGDSSRVRASTSVQGLEPCQFDAGPAIEPGPPGDWGNYVKAAVRTLVEERREPSRGLDLYIASDLPVAAGLSSSSALVVAVALAFMWVNRDSSAPRFSLDLPGRRAALAERLAIGERFVGTAGGAMDQGASLLGVAGHALAMDFRPLRAQAVRFPPDWRVVVAHSGDSAEKSGAAQEAYNRLTKNASAAADSVSAKLRDRGSVPRQNRWSTDGGLASYPRLFKGTSARRLIDLAESILSEEQLRSFRHIGTEHCRVRAMLCALGDEDLTAAGDLMNASHASLRDDLAGSTPALDSLVDRARSAGAAGARLTGAGMGGCAIALCHRTRVDDVLSTLRAFEDEVDAPRVGFAARPSWGARVRDVESADLSPV